jgi:hypothetical protein
MRCCPPPRAIDMRCISFVIVSVSTSIFFNSTIFSQELSLQERIKIGTDAIKLGCGIQSTASKVDVQGGVDGSITLTQPPGAAGSGQIHYSSRETVGLIAAFQQTISAEGARLSEVQINCMKTYVDRIVSTVLPPTESEQARSERRQACFSTCDDGRSACLTGKKSEYEGCIEDRRQVCLRSCTNGYHIPMAECISNYCNVDTGSNRYDWPSKCHARQDLSDCDTDRVSCRTTCLSN